jgi:hypothetical protein
VSVADRFAWRWRAVAVAVTLLLIPVARSSFRATPGPTSPAATAPSSLTIVSPADGSVLGGNVAHVLLDAPGGTGVSFAAFADAAPPSAGSPVRHARGVVVSSAPLIVVGGLSKGPHVLTLVLVDEAGRRTTDLVDRVSITTTGPTLVATADVRSVEGSPWPIAVRVDGIRIVPADGDTSGATGHLHFLIDLDLPPAGIPIGLDAENVVHTTETTVPLTGLGAGEHHVWVVVGDGTHRPLSPYVADEVFVTVTR